MQKVVGSSPIIRSEGKSRYRSGAPPQRREIDEIGTVEVAPRLSHRTLAVPAFGSTDRTWPISPVAFLRTWPGGSAETVLRAFPAELRRALFSVPRRSGLAAVRSSRSRRGAGRESRRGSRSTFSSGTMFAPVPFVSVSRTHVFAILS